MSSNPFHVTTGKGSHWDLVLNRDETMNPAEAALQIACPSYYGHEAEQSGSAGPAGQADSLRPCPLPPRSQFRFLL